MCYIYVVMCPQSHGRLWNAHERRWGALPSSTCCRLATDGHVRVSTGAFKSVY